MRITFVTPGWGLSGGDRVIAIYADRLVKRGHQVLLVAPGDRGVDLVEMFRRMIRALLGRPALPRREAEGTHLSPHVPRYRLKSWRPLRDKEIPEADIVIATWWETAEWVNKMSTTKGAKVFFLQHYEAFDYTPKSRVDAVWRLPFHKITISKWLVELARSKFGDSRVSLIHNSVESSQFFALPRQRNAIPTIGILYSEAFWKGTDVCLEAIRHLSFKTNVIAFGAGIKSPGENGTLSLPEGSKYFYRPDQTYLREIYAQCDVWLCGSRGEGFHLPPLEAMACRCPVVSTAVGGPIDIIKDGINGYVRPIGDVVGLADCLSEVLLSSPEAWRKMSDEALETAEGYTWDQATDLFEEALNVAVARKRAGEIA